MSKNFNSKKKVIVGMSGGVDSSIAVWLLLQQGYQVEGLFMKNWEEDDTEDHCTATKDLEDAQIVSNQLGIKLHTINFATEYWNNVFKKFLSEYQLGRTPNPDILCNKEIKFKAFLIFAINELRASYIATGHYARRIHMDGKYFLLRALDLNKDQTYFLYTLRQKQISQSLFPLGTLKKLEVRRLAEELKLVTAKKKDSMGICFIGKRKLTEFLSRYINTAKSGPIVTIEGETIAMHQGLMYHTIGQRKGLKIGGTKKSNTYPWYVVDKDIKNNTLIVAQGNNHPYLMSIGLIAQNLHWINPVFLCKPLQCTVQTRYHQDNIPCTITSIKPDCIKVKFSKPVSAVTPGQSAVFYLNEICLGGGIIEQRLPLENN